MLVINSTKPNGEIVPEYYRDALNSLAETVHNLNEENHADALRLIVSEIEETARDVRKISKVQKHIIITPEEVGEIVAAYDIESLSFCYYSNLIAKRYGEKEFYYLPDYDIEAEAKEWAKAFGAVLVDLLKSQAGTCERCPWVVLVEKHTIKKQFQAVFDECGKIWLLSPNGLIDLSHHWAFYGIESLSKAGKLAKCRANLFTRKELHEVKSFEDFQNKKEFLYNIFPKLAPSVSWWDMGDTLEDLQTVNGRSVAHSLGFDYFEPYTQNYFKNKEDADSIRELSGSLYIKRNELLKKNLAEFKRALKYEFYNYEASYTGDYLEAMNEGLGYDWEDLTPEQREIFEETRQEWRHSHE